MRQKLLPATATVGLLLSLVLSCPAFSEEEKIFEGDVGGTAVIENVNGSKAKLHEYSDTRSGFYGEANAFYDSPTQFFRFHALDMGYDTQHYRLEGGPYGIFKGYIDYNETIHNITTDAKTFYSGVGSGLLLGVANPNPEAWTSTFDYYTKRKKFNAGFEFKMAKPFFFNVDYLHEEKEGVKPTGASVTSPGGIALELPEPVDYRTNWLKLDGGYAKNPLFISFSYVYSDFRNVMQDLYFTNPAGTLLDPKSLAPDSLLHKFGFQGNLKLPFNSKFAVNIHDSTTKSDTSSFTAFDGKINTRSYDIALTTSPFRFLDGKVYYKYYDRDNKSSVATDPTFTFFSYTTKAFGIDADFRLPLQLKLDVGYKHLKTERTVENETDPSAILPYNTDNVYSATLRWAGLSFVSARMAYEKLDRSADYRTIESDLLLNKKFAYAAQDRNTFKTVVDIFPMDTLNFSLEYSYKKATYNEIIYGVTDDTRNGFNFTADYSLKKIARFYGYFDYETIVMNQEMIRPSVSQWDAKQEEKTYGYGIRADVYAIPKKLTLVFQGDYLRANGSDDYTFYNNAIWSSIGVPIGSPVNVPNWDDYQKYSLSFKALYNFTEALSVKAGYAYERYIYSDGQLNNYNYIPNSGTGSSGAYLTGAYSRPVYSANIVFVGLTYRFK